MSDKPVLKVDGLRTYFRTADGIAKAVDGVSFAINPGETYALVGESGCGKSVTALSILRLVAEPAGYNAGGTITFRDMDIASLPPIEMRSVRGNGISMIFQEPMTALNPVFTVGNQISEAILVHQRIGKKEARKLGIEMLDRVRIPDPAKRYDEYPHQMSGGMRQRVMIAMALACKPELLIADEPTTALDVTIQSQILELVRDLKNEMNTAVLLITHDMGVVRENADRVGVMYAGKIVEEASQEDLFANPSHPYTKLLMESLPGRTERGQRLATIKGNVPKATSFPEGCRFCTRCPFIMAKCQIDEPTRDIVAPGHSAACWLVDQRSEVRDQRSGQDDQSELGNQNPARNAAHSAAGGSKSGIETNRGSSESSDHPIIESSCELIVDELRTHFPIKKGLLQSVVAQVKAVDGTSLKIAKGETLALVGESGCGKTTVGKSIVQLEKPTAGSIQFGSRELVGLPRKALHEYRRKIQMIFQDPFSSLNPRLLIRDVILEGMETHRIGGSRTERLDRARSLMTKVGLQPNMLMRYPHEFSGGQRQRIGIARALAVEPELIICDESTSSLDVSVQAQILNLLKDLQNEFGLAYLFITHDLSVVKYLADRVSVMYLGRIVEEGTNEEIFNTPKHPYTRALLSAVPQIDANSGLQKIILQGDVPSPIDPPEGCHFHPRCPEARAECSQAYPDSSSFSPTHSCKCVLYP